MAFSVMRGGFSMKATATAPHRLTIRALEARVRRRLAREGEVLHKCRQGSRWYPDLGDYYAANERNHLVRTHIDLEQLAEELGVIGAAESVAE
jgi:hypothetical protein